jgi:hypothetical protein
MVPGLLKNSRPGQELLRLRSGEGASLRGPCLGPGLHSEGDEGGLKELTAHG